MAEKIGEAILELRTDVKKLVQGMDKARQSADKSMKKMQTRADKFAKFMKSAAGLGGLAVAFAGVARAMKKAFEVGQYAAAQRQTAMAFKSIAEDAGAMADDIIKNMRRMSGETISELDMMLSANRASLLGIPVDEFDDLMAIARASATATGESVGKMFDDIVKGIGRGSPMILDNLGIVLKVEDAYKIMADSLGTTTAALTKQQQTQAILNATLKSGEDIIRKVGEAGQTLTDVERWQQVTAAAADFKAELGMRLLPIMGQIFESSSKTLRAWTENLRISRLTKEAYQALKNLAEGEALAADDYLLILKDEEKRLGQIAASYEMLDEKAVTAWKSATKAIIDYQAAQGALALAESRQALAKTAAAKKEADEDAADAQRILDTIEFVKNVNEAYAKTPEGIAAILEEEIKLWEYRATQADITLPKIQAYLDMLYEQRDAEGELTIALEDHMSAAEALSIAAAEGYLIEKEAAEAALKAAEELLEQKKEQVAFITGPFVDAYSDAFGKFGEILVEGGNAWEVFREAFKESIAGLLDAIGQKLIIMAGEALIPLPVLWNPAGAALAFAGAAAAFTSAGVVRALATGADIETHGPEMIMVGDNPGGRERVTVTPLSSPNINGPGVSSQPIIGDVYFDGYKVGKWISKMSNNGHIMINPRGIKK